MGARIRLAAALAIGVVVAGCKGEASPAALPSLLVSHANIDRMITDIVEHRTDFATLNFNDRDNYYIQLLFTDDGLVVEAASNRCSTSYPRLSADQEASLTRLGWLPNEGCDNAQDPRTCQCHPTNWWRLWAWPASPLDLVEPVREFILQTLPTYGWTPTTPVTVDTGNL